MFTTRRSALLALPAVLAASLLAGCTPGGGGDGGSGDGGAGDGGLTPGAGTANECIGRTWQLDINDQAQQLGQSLADSGLTVVSSTAEGVVFMDIDTGGTITGHNDVTYMISVNDGELDLTTVQTHSGDTSGSWYWTSADNDRMTFEAWDNTGFTIQTTTIVNGTPSETSTNIPTTDMTGLEMSVSCESDTLTTQADGSPYVQHWNPRD